MLNLVLKSCVLPYSFFYMYVASISINYIHYTQCVEKY